MATGEIGLLVLAWTVAFGLLVVLPLIVAHEVARVLDADSRPTVDQVASGATSTEKPDTNDRTKMEDETHPPASVHGEYVARRR